MDERRSHQHESDVLLRQLDGHLARLEARHEHHELALATRIAVGLRELITDTMLRYATGTLMLLFWLAYYYIPRREDVT